MQEELQKRNTDCVYFLASPLTCKKGIECEYRHNEIARLNPRDCWYWLGGNCLNPNCAFRHPPLDGRTETESESASANQQSTLPVKKTNVPCFYFYNGFCNKGERCFFVHEPDENASSWKSSKQASAVPDEPLVEKKVTKESDSRPVPAEISSFGTDSKSTARTNVMLEQKFEQSISHHLPKQNACPQISEPPSEEAATIRSNSFIHSEDLIQRSHDTPERSSDDQLDDHIKQEDWLESSPGFDVLVNDRSEDLDYKDEALYTLQHDMEEREINGQRLRYDYEDIMEYDPTYPDLRVSFDRGLPDYYDDHLDVDICNNARRRTPISARGRMLDRTLRLKRGLLQAELSSVDLRDYLKKRRMTESRHPNLFFGRPNSINLMDKIKITEEGYIGNLGLHGRLASKVEISAESRFEREGHRSVTYQHPRTRHASSKRTRKPTKARRLGKRHILSEISGKTLSRKRRSTEDSTMFTGPKTLAQLKEEKKKMLGRMDLPDPDGTEPSSSKA